MEGGCHCKSVRFKTTAEPFWVGACYCVDCRKVSGAPYMVWAGFASGDVQMTQGFLKGYASSEKVNRSFCENCGSPFLYQYKESQEKIFIAAGAFDDASTLEPKDHIWTEQKLSWIHIAGDIK